MIYLDNGATTFPKPQVVVDAVNNSLKNYSANPGRSGHKLALKASSEIYNCRKSVAELFNIKAEENVVFTLNCTMALNTIIKGMLKSGDHVVVSCMEHNSVMRPLQKLSKMGVTYTCATVYPYDNDRTVDSFRKSLRPNTALVICIHCSNVFGFKLPVSRITALCHQYNIPVCIDLAQSAGVVPIDTQFIGADFYAIAGHKGLYAPLGTGILLINTDGRFPESLMEGGTGSNSLELEQPTAMPDLYESGTPNLNGIVGLRSGVNFVKNKGIDNIYDHEMGLIASFYDMIKDTKNVVLYTERPCKEFFAPILSFNIKDISSEEIATILNQKYNIAVRAGLHCSPFAHDFMGTKDIGTVRVCPSIFTTKRDMVYTANAIQEISYKISKRQF